eukprot:7210369-Prymnesium_polylepis.2
MRLTFLPRRIPVTLAQDDLDVTPVPPAPLLQRAACELEDVIKGTPCLLAVLQIAEGLCGIGLGTHD